MPKKKMLDEIASIKEGEAQEASDDDCDYPVFKTIPSAHFLAVEDIDDIGFCVLRWINLAQVRHAEFNNKSGKLSIYFGEKESSLHIVNPDAIRRLVNALEFLS
jgi:hypothetical protein